MNKWHGIGRTTKDIELRYTTGASQMAVARFTLAVNRRKRQDGTQEADFISCIAWGKTAEIMEKYVHKGDQIGIVGRIQTGSYDKDGHKVYTTDVVVEELEFLEKKKDSTQGGSGPTQSEIPEGFSMLDEDIPF